MSQNTHVDLFLAAALRSFNGDPQTIIKRLDSVSRASRSGRVIEWRKNDLTDFRNCLVPVSAERLVRWDYRYPNAIFRVGFVPHFAPASGEVLPDQYFNLSQHVQQNTLSIFIGTARFYCSEDNRGTRWAPRDRRNRFEYEIFAFAGIDANFGLGSQH
ncbi:hypothetical protein F4859DRAFT_514381 [Xylaria cf. heliscus]|nr:hypothetical protein F4859DRAFT_514381 [Xylaria cf. heliscus]